MNEKRCTDCKYTKGIGYDFWCGEGHTEYEVFGAETNCPYYEYHDWSKGTPSRTKKRFTIKTVEEDCIFDNQDCKYYDELNMTIELLNELWEELVELKNKQIKSIDENEQLKQYKQAVSDVLLSYSQKNLSAKQLGLLTAIMHELGVLE